MAPALVNYLGGIVFCASPNQLNLGGHLPWATSSPWLWAHFCLERCAFCPSSPPRSRCGGVLGDLPQAGLADSSSHVPLHVRSTELLPNLCLVLLRPGSSCPCVGYKFVTGGGGHLQKVHFCCHFLSSVTFAPSQYSLPCVPRHSSCTGLTCSLAILTGFELAL